MPVEFVGHPLIDLATPSASRDVFLRGLGLTPSAPTVAILPGSRPNEVSRILPDLAAAARLIRRAGARRPVPGRPRAASRRRACSTRCAPAPGDTRFAVVEGDTDTVLASADVALTASGTATVQAALHDTPMIVVYRMAPLSYQLAKRVVTLDTIGMVNLIAGEKIAPELVQDAFTPEAVAREAVSMLTDPRPRRAHARRRSRRCAPASAAPAPAAARRKRSCVLSRNAECAEHAKPDCDG